MVALRTIHEIIEADRGALVGEVLFNGIVDTIDRRTGQFVRPCLVSLRAERDVFAAIKLRRVDPIACLRHLQAGLSAQPDQLEGVPPVIDFDRAAGQDFTGEFNVLADIDERPNLATMADDEYEQLLSDLFGNMGLEMGEAAAGPRWLATDPRPLFGGPVVIYAQRGKAVDAPTAAGLAEEVAAAGATKGILVAIDGVEVEAHEAVAGRPIELLDGPTLLNLLAEHSRVKARIEPV